MVKAMARRLLERALKRAGCVKRTPDKGPHSTWVCPCTRHTAYLPHHREITPGVVKGTIDPLKCLPEGWWKR